MVYVEKILVKGNTYYKLVQSIRKGSLVRHRSKYIGKELPGKRKLLLLKEAFRKNLYKKYRYLTDNDFEKIENKKKSYLDEFSKLSTLEKDKIVNEFIVRFTYDSSKLAGVRISLRETFLILQEKVIPKNITSINTVKEIENHKLGIQAVTKYKGPLNFSFLKRIHRILLTGVDDTIAGKFRYTLKKNVKIAGTPFVPVSWQRLEKSLENFLVWYEYEKRKLHPLELAAFLHLKIISIQPFVDGNSRLSRLLMNWILWKKNYPPIDIPVLDIENYYKALDTYQIEGKERAFIEYIKKQYFKSV